MNIKTNPADLRWWFWTVTLLFIVAAVAGWTPGYGIVIAISAAQVFAQPYVMTGGGPGDASRFLVLYADPHRLFRFHAVRSVAGTEAGGLPVAPDRNDHGDLLRPLRHRAGIEAGAMEPGARGSAELSGVRSRWSVLDRFARLSCLLWLLAVAWLAGASAAAPGIAAVPTSPLVLQVYVQDGCPHCAAAKRFVERLQRERPALRVEYRVVDQDPLAARTLHELALANGVWPPGVPAFAVDSRLLAMGFDDEAHTGRAIAERLDATAVANAIADASEAARKSASAAAESGAGRVPGAAARVDAAPLAPPPVQSVDHALFGTLSASRLGLPSFTLALGLLDGFNPCAMWVLLFLLSVLVRLQDRRRMALIAGTFVLVSAAVYYAFMAAWLNIFLAVGLTKTVRWALGAVALVIGVFNVKDAVAWGHGPSLAIPDRAKPGLVARMRRAMHSPTLPASMLAVAGLAVVVNFVELLCTAGLPALFTAVLAQHELSTAAHHAYLGLYILGYIADDALMVGVAVAALSSGKLGERGGRWLKLVSGAVMLGLGVVLLLRPQWLM